MKTPLNELILQIEEQQQRFIDLSKADKKMKKGVDAILTATTILKMKAKNLLEKEKSEMSRSFEQGKQAQWEQDNMKKGLQPHNISFDEYFSQRYEQAVS